MKALEIDRLLGRIAGMANGYGNLGIVHEKKGDLNLAESMYQKALTIDLKLGRQEGIADDYDNLANLHIRKGQRERAEELWLKAVKIYEDLGNVVEMNRIQASLNEQSI